MLIREMLKEDFCPHVNDIMFDVNGKLINGQHTLSAIVETNKTYNICVKRGLPDRAASHPHGYRRKTYSL